MQLAVYGMLAMYRLGSFLAKQAMSRLLLCRHSASARTESNCSVQVARGKASADAYINPLCCVHSAVSLETGSLATPIHDFWMGLQVDSDGDRLGFETLMSQLIEFLMTLVGNKRFVDLIQQAVPRLIYITLGASAGHAPDAQHFLSDWKT